MPKVHKCSVSMDRVTEGGGGRYKQVVLSKE